MKERDAHRDAAFILYQAGLLPDWVCPIVVSLATVAHVLLREIANEVELLRVRRLASGRSCKGWCDIPESRTSHHRSIYGGMRPVCYTVPPLFGKLPWGHFVFS
jgi:hypothetical protein